jgi:putative membrane protein
MPWLLRWAFNTVALFVTVWLLPGIDDGDSWWTLGFAGAVFTVVNAFLKPVLTILSIPFIVVTLGLFYFLLNILMLYITDWIVPGFSIETFWWGALGAIVMSLVNGTLHLLFGDPLERDRGDGTLVAAS